MDILSAQRVHIIGIGGIGVSGVAKILKHRGVVVSGSDAEASGVTEGLNALGIAVAIGHDSANVAAVVDAVIFSGAVPTDNSERAAARDRGIPEFSYSEVLGMLSKHYRTIAVSGTHGKSTTTAMLGTILRAAGLDPLILVGTQVATFEQGNVHLGSGEFFVVEACEHEAQMMKLSPERIIVTNLEPDHLDFYGTFAVLQKTFSEYVARVPAEHCVLNFDEQVVRELCRNSATQPRSFGFQGGTIQCVARRTEDGEQVAQLRDAVGEEFELKLRIPGAFNVMNAMAAFEMARSIGVAPHVALDALHKYPGSWRRFERVGELNGAPVISDYGHHPTAIRETVAATREFFPGKRVVLVYQPHQHHRTHALYPDFVSALADPDMLILNEVYDVKGRERAEDQSVSGTQLFEDIKKTRTIDGGQMAYAASLDEIEALVCQHALPNDVILVMGAGDIYKIAHRVCSK